VNRVHQLLELAYRRINPTAFANYQETAITGELVRMMDEVIDDPASPRWVRHLSAHDDPPVNAPGRLGRSRKRLDIKIVSAQRSPRNRFSFEAKRLGKDNPVRNYLGDEGLGCFLSGDYAREEDEAGMLGYLQSGTADGWAPQIRDSMAINAKDFMLVQHGAWKHQPWRHGPQHTYITRHSRKNAARNIDIYHTLLVCC
jgi:hypothetical protein